MQSFVTLHYWAGKAMLTHFSPMLHFCTPTFSGGIEMKCWAGKSYVKLSKLWRNQGFNPLSG